jgi:hypothetical protein
MELDKAKVLDAVKELVLERTVSTRDVANKLAAGSDTDATAIEYEVQEWLDRLTEEDGKPVTLVTHWEGNPDDSPKIALYRLKFTH